MKNDIFEQLEHDKHQQDYPNDTTSIFYQLTAHPPLT